LRKHRQDDIEESDRKRHKKEKKEKKNKEKRDKKKASDSDSEDESTAAARAAQADAARVWKEKAAPVNEEFVGPQPLRRLDRGSFSEKELGGNLLPGEGAATLAYVQAGKRIPRRGEVGLSSDDITRYESLGYVMSGSRHARMNAIRIRKENQIIGAAEKRQLLQFNMDERSKHENKILGDFRELLNNKVRELETLKEQKRI